MDAPRNQDRIALKGISQSIRPQSPRGVWDVECRWVWASPLKVTALHVCFWGEELHRSFFLLWVLECSREAALSSWLSWLMKVEWVMDTESIALPLTDLLASAVVDMAFHHYLGDQNFLFFFFLILPQPYEKDALSCSFWNHKRLLQVLEAHENVPVRTILMNCELQKIPIKNRFFPSENMKDNHLHQGFAPAMCIEKCFALLMPSSMPSPGEGRSLPPQSLDLRRYQKALAEAVI